ncbi:class I SAM-dependent DNA methyltransferase [Staphylococcus caledonicus]|uniref:class I SAM-dependent DNA methyltransferase n=1 Tax=Staphylococcus caledonicus TaxID=2741333 RepID=UPI0018E403D1|nr:class I SAM-dependent methyltransferase [Staphylococcus caledonicus]MBI5972630.1 class I SAM-dependent methyltransferase [Staphylococcus caledonicus]
MSQYVEMSAVYDQLAQDQPYDKWYDIVKYYTQSFNKDLKLLDIGCGTGSLTSKLTSIGSVTGIDLSADMLSIAVNKSNQVTWLEGDMTDFSLNTKFDVITIFCDSLNYLPDIEDVQQTFQCVMQHLDDSGIFIFDVHTIFKMNTLFNNQCYIDENEQVFLAWEAIAGEEPNSVYHDMNFFIKNSDGNYHRFDESHYQRTFDKDTYIQLLKQVGFSNIETFVDFSIENHDDKGERLFFVARK